MTGLFIDSYSIVIQALIIAFLISFILQILYWAGIFARMLYSKPRRSGIRLFPISVIICAKNEELNLRNILPLILEQDYPEFEVIVVNPPLIPFRFNGFWDVFFCYLSCCHTAPLSFFESSYSKQTSCIHNTTGSLYVHHYDVVTPFDWLYTYDTFKHVSLVFSS